jgi:hypothetical protein
VQADADVISEIDDPRSRDGSTLTIADVGNAARDPVCFCSVDDFACYMPALPRAARNSNAMPPHDCCRISSRRMLRGRSSRRTKSFKLMNVGAPDPLMERSCETPLNPSVNSTPVLADTLFGGVSK